MKNSIRNWILGPFIGLFLIPLIITTAFFTFQNYYKEKENIFIHQQKLTVLASQKISTFLHEQIQVLSTMLQTNYLPGLTLDQKKNLLGKFIASVKDDRQKTVYHKVSLLDETGIELLQVSRVKLDQNSTKPDMSATREFIVPATSNSIYYSPIFYDDITGEPYMTISMPIQNIQTLALSGVLVSKINLRALWNYIDSMQIGSSGTAYITDKDGRLIAHQNRSLVYSGKTTVIPDSPVERKGITGTESIIAAHKIHFGERDLVFLTEWPTSEAFQHINRTLLIISIFLVCMFLGALTVCYIVINKIIRPIESLAATAGKISRGDLSLKAEPSRLVELGDLAIAFNTMLTQLISSIKDIEKEKDFVSNVIESLSYPFYVIDVYDYTIKLANSASGFGPLDQNKTCYELTHNTSTPCSGDEHPCTIQEILKTKKPVTVEHIHHVDDVTSQIIEIYGFPVFDEFGEVRQVIEYNIDVTEKRNLEAQLYQSQRLESVGIMTGGVAHDFNNLLTTILGYSQLALMNPLQSEADKDSNEAIFEAAEKAADLTRQLLAFSRKQVMEMKVINLNDLVQNISKMLKRLIGENIEIKTQLKESLGNIRADQGQTEQVLVNLVINARDAIDGNGTVYIETSAAELDEKYCSSHADITPGSYILLSVTDTGQGMSPEVKEKIFDPFFTTKTHGKGTGLGLSMVYGIIKQLKGHIYVYTEQSRGTSFKIYFPEEGNSVADPLTKQKNVILPGTETILIVDDEDSILRLTRDTLQPIGYTVYITNCAQDAIALASESGISIDIMLTDVIMPEMNGRELAEQIKPLQPEMKVLFMSGYTDNIIAQEGILKQGVNFIQKPLIPTVLTNKLREVLDS